MQYTAVMQPIVNKESSEERKQESFETLDWKKEIDLKLKPLGKTGVTADRDKIEFRLVNSSSLI